MRDRVLVVAPHPDDEVLGVGGTIARLASEGCDVYVLVVTQGHPPTFSEQAVAARRREALAASRLLGVKETLFRSLPAAGLDTVPHRDVNAELREVMDHARPDILFVPFNGDIHLDHQATFLSCLVAARPNDASAPRTIYAYETLSETNWNAPHVTPGFAPNVFIDISDTLDRKIAALQAYGSALQEFPHERSIEAVRALATLRGATVYRRAAEAFVLIRDVR